MPVPTPCPSTSCITVTPGFSRIHRLVFFMGFIEDPSPHDISSIHGHLSTCNLKLLLPEGIKKLQFEHNQNQILKRPSSNCRKTITIQARDLLLKNEWEGEKKLLNVTWLCPGTAGNNMLPNSCKHVPLGKEKRQYDFLLQPLNLTPRSTTRNLSPQTSTPGANAAIGSLNTLRMVTTTFLTNALT